jgi:hypothetical protein
MRRLPSAALVLAALALVANPAAPAHLQAPPVLGPFAEVTEVDILGSGKIDAQRLSTFGMHLGQSTRQAQTALWKYEKALGLHPKPNVDVKENLFSIEVCDSLTGLIAAVFAPLGDSIITRVEWYVRMQDYLVGQSRRLLDPSMGVADSDLRLTLLGREDARRENVDRATLSQTVTNTYLYDREGIRVIRRRMVFEIANLEPADLTYIQLVFPAKPR